MLSAVRCRAHWRYLFLLSFATAIYLLALILLVRYPPKRSSRYTAPRPIRYNAPGTFPSRNRDPRHRPQCQGFPNTTDVLLVIKTGATEMMSKLPPLLMTSHECVQDKVVFSDIDSMLGDVHIHDALAYLPESVKQRNRKELKLHEILLRSNQLGLDFGPLGQLKHAEQAWSMDKYKNIPMAEQAYRMYPGKKWYLFVDTDTFVFWPNMAKWLDSLDPTEPLFLGSPVTTQSGVSFAHGGSGYIMTTAAIRQFVGSLGDTSEGLARSPKILQMLKSMSFSDECCGDVIISKALLSQGINVTSAWPSISGQQPSTIHFGPMQWCQPVLTLHHINSESVSQLFKYEKRRGSSGSPILFSELFKDLLEPYLTTTKEDWFNDAEDEIVYPPNSPIAGHQPPLESMTPLQRDSWKSYNDCKAACSEHPKCYQFTYSSKRECGFAFGFSLGQPRKPGEDGERWSSGWNQQKIKSFIIDHSPCPTPRWIIPGRI